MHAGLLSTFLLHEPMRLVVEPCCQHSQRRSEDVSFVVATTRSQNQAEQLLELTLVGTPCDRFGSRHRSAPVRSLESGRCAPVTKALPRPVLVLPKRVLFRATGEIRVHTG